MDEEGTKTLREAMVWLKQHITELAGKTVGYVCNRQNNKLLHKAVLLLERYGYMVEYVHPISKLLEALTAVEGKLNRATTV